MLSYPTFQVLFWNLVLKNVHALLSVGLIADTILITMVLDFSLQLDRHQFFLGGCFDAELFCKMLKQMAFLVGV